MILHLQRNTSLVKIEALQQRLKHMGFNSAYESDGVKQALVLLSGVDDLTCQSAFTALPEVERVQPFTDNFKLVGKGVKSTPSQVNCGDLSIGSDEFVVMAGPCSIESREQIFQIAACVSQQGATVLRGGAFKPRTSPYDFQGLGEKGLLYMHEAARRHHMRCVSEIMSHEDLACAEQYLDIIQIGARNMQNTCLLKALGKVKKPVLLKRGLSATYKEFLCAAEYIISAGNPHVILCERGIRTFETYCRNTLDLAAVPLLKELSHLPIIVDPSHGVGLRHAVPPLSKAALAVGADGLIIEVHTDPDCSVSDAAQTIGPDTFATLMHDLRRLAPALNRRVKS